MPTRRRAAVLVLSAAVLAGAGAVGVHLMTADRDGGADAAPVTSAAVGAVSTDPGTSVGQNHLEPGPGDPVATDPDPATVTTEAGAVISYADFEAGTGVEIGGYVTGVVQDGGTCRAVLSRGDQQVSAETSGVADASTTSCGGLVVPADELSKGTWTVELQYESEGTVYASPTTDVEVTS